ncbi:HPP family protein [Streptomyces sp. C10-9-1]|uniref:CBS domain-containing protein n=1 Tax=Streptomyces sp. C10-9-1 TaxID=1859285 RepID=UPI00273A6451|nr:CBS domain-containing protein [Streptomyces sp. C10-9-1]
MAERTVGEVMTREVVTLAPGAPVGQAARLLAARRVGAAPVLDGEDRVVGVASRGDLASGGRDRPGTGAAREPSGAEGAAEGLTVRHVMAAPAVTVHPEQRVAVAARAMERRGVDRLPVVDEADRIIGIVTRRDLLRVFLRSDAEILADVRRTLRSVLGTAASARPDAAVREGLVVLGGPPARDRGRLLRALWRIDGVTGVLGEAAGAPEAGGAHRPGGAGEHPAGPWRTAAAAGGPPAEG